MNVDKNENAHAHANITTYHTHIRSNITTTAAQSPNHMFVLKCQISTLSTYTFMSRFK